LSLGGQGKRIGHYLLRSILFNDSTSKRFAEMK
jgi:hypothetical protein